MSIRPLLEQTHASWRDELEAALGPARRSNAGPWTRWTAIRYLEHAFPERVRRERRLLELLGPRLSEVERMHLWALGELLDILPVRLGQLIGLCHRAREFEAETARIVVVMNCWCRAVEATLGPLPVSSLSEEARVLLDAPAAEPQPAPVKKASLAIHDTPEPAGRC